MSVAAREIAVTDPPSAWERLGFAVGPDGACTIGGIRLAMGRERFEVAIDGLTAGCERPDGLGLVAASGGAAAGPATAHPNGAVVVDHVVALTDDLARTLAALEGAGLELRRIREPPEAPARQAFLRLGEMILEVVERAPAAGPPSAFWGLVVVVADLDALATGFDGLIGTPRDAVQPGRRIATARRAAGLATALAFMTPRPQPPAPR